MSCMSYTSVSMPLSICGVGLRVGPYREWAVSPVSLSVRVATYLPASSVPSRPCSGVSKHTRFTLLAECKISRVSLPLESTPVWLVINPTRFPLSGSNSRDLRRSMPSCTAWEGIAQSAKASRARALQKEREKAGCGMPAQISLGSGKVNGPQAWERIFRGRRVSSTV